MELEFQQLQAEKVPLSKAAQGPVFKSSIDGVSGSRTRDEMLETVEPQYFGLAMKLASEFSNLAARSS